MAFLKLQLGRKGNFNSLQTNTQSLELTLKAETDINENFKMAAQIVNI